jgi:hypothetical protein
VRVGVGRDCKRVTISPEGSRSLIIGFQIEYKLITTDLPSPFLLSL